MTRRLLLTLALGSVLAAPAVTAYADDEEKKKDAPQLILAEGDDEKKEKSDSQLLLSEGDEEKKADKDQAG